MTSLASVPLAVSLWASFFHDVRLLFRGHLALPSPALLADSVHRLQIGIPTSTLEHRYWTLLSMGPLARGGEKP